MSAISWLLSVHITGACLTAGLVFVAWLALLARRKNQYRFYAVAIGIATIVQTGSGIFLSREIITPVSTLALIKYCSQIGIYLAVVLGTEVLLLRPRVREQGVRQFLIYRPSPTHTHLIPRHRLTPHIHRNSAQFLHH